MFLVTAATRLELKSFFRHFGASDHVVAFSTGVGLVETAVSLTSFLAVRKENICGVINIGIAGAYVYDGSPQVLDLCLASCEFLGDLGICHDDHITLLEKNLVSDQGRFVLDKELRKKAEWILRQNGCSFHLGNFITVQCVSGTRKRGDRLAKAHQGMCENMEGAAVARACEAFALPLVELRCISNLVEDRNKQYWKIKEAADLSGKAASLLVKGLLT